MDWGAAILVAGGGPSCVGIRIRGPLLATGHSTLRWSLDVEAKAGEIDVAVTEEKERTEAWLGKDVENAVEDGLGVRADNVATLA